MWPRHQNLLYRVTYPWTAKILLQWVLKSGTTLLFWGFSVVLNNWITFLPHQAESVSYFSVQHYNLLTFALQWTALLQWLQPHCDCQHPKNKITSSLLHAHGAYWRNYCLAWVNWLYSNTVWMEACFLVECYGICWWFSTCFMCLISQLALWSDISLTFINLYNIWDSRADIVF